MKRKSRIKIGFMVLVAAMGFETGYAISDDSFKKDSTLLEEVVVTAAKIPEKQESITQKIDSIYEEDADRMIFAGRNISEMFQYQPGTFISVLSRSDANWGSYGGLGPRYNAYLLDGIPVDSFVDTMSLDREAFERGEVQRGPASVMYSNYLTMDFAGNQSPLAGTTNLILKDKIEKAATRLALGYGSYETLGGRIYHQDSRGDFHYFLGSSYEKSDYTNYGTADSWLNMIDDPEYQKTKIYLKTSYFFGREDHKISFFGHHTQHDGDA
ncbi:MAG: TonB-dependent receptor, partial [Thermodesulfobacteriota bacterium]